jgi:hypothetical protein
MKGRQIPVTQRAQIPATQRAKRDPNPRRTEIETSLAHGDGRAPLAALVADMGAFLEAPSLVCDPS